MVLRWIFTADGENAYVCSCHRQGLDNSAEDGKDESDVETHVDERFV
jgi:hypothetical protein